jgi:hypothetical protein
MTTSKSIFKRTSTILLAGAFAALAACGDSGDEPGDPNDPNPDPDPDAAYSVSGTVLDLETGLPIDGTASIIIEGVQPAPSVTASGADFTIDQVPANSAFNILAGSPPAYRTTYNAAVEVGNQDVTDLELFAVREEYLTSLISSFGVTPTAGTGVIIARAIGEDGQPFAGLPGAAFDLPAQVVGPYFLDADLQPDPGLSATSESGFVVLFDVAPGLVSVSSLDGADYGITMPDSPVAATTVTYALLNVVDGEVEPLPTNLSFQNDIAPIFESRGCVNCHDGGGPGKDLGGLHLNGATEKMYKEVAMEMSPSYNVLRVDPANPEASLLLTMPSFEDPPDRHPFATFTGDNDIDYRLIKAWIEEGALNN